MPCTGSDQAGGVDRRDRRRHPARGPWRRPLIGRPGVPRPCRTGIALLGLLSGSTVMLLAVTLWVLYGSPIHPRSASVHTPGMRIAAGTGEPLGVSARSKSQELRGGTLRANPRRRPGHRTGPVAEAMIPPAAASDQSGSSSVNAAEQKAKETQAEAGAEAGQPQLARTETQDTRPTAQQQEAARALTDSASSDAMQCRSLRGHIQVFPCRGLHLPALSGRTAKSSAS